MYLRTAAATLTATIIGLTSSHAAFAADGPGLSVSVRENDSDSDGDGPLQQGAPIVVTSDVDLTSLAADGNGSFTVKSPAFTKAVTVGLLKNSFGQGNGTIRCDIKAGSYPVDIAGHHDGLTGSQGHLTITVKSDDHRYCTQAAGSSGNTGTVAAVGGGVVLLAAAGYTVARRRRTKGA
ncbi:hypothetical protein [Streptomyces glomeratus]|jgi:hypothetical protein|uniref:Gram-positive cocci surface proteins LPxTG domain-containing protein n=1 Tax=Streptomyces glomeratus TaxID=284452 RepID=A0ABP6L8M2_9ACTN|nr:hypothetical protein [Streptomyces glomeratus]MCF1507181.1 hypothetical protein [Streptomyces glomeratus]